MKRLKILRDWRLPLGVVIGGVLGGAGAIVGLPPSDGPRGLPVVVPVVVAPETVPVVVAPETGGNPSTLSDSPASDVDQGAVMAVEKAFETAKMAGDIAAIDRIVDADYVSVNQHGSRRDKAGYLAMFKNGYRVSPLETTDRQVKLSGAVAIVTGTQHGATTYGADANTVFTRVYVKRSAGWRLLSVTHFYDPRKPPPNSSSVKIPVRHPVP